MAGLTRHDIQYPARPPADAALVASDAGADFVGPVSGRLVGEMGIGHLGADQADHVGHAAGYDGLGVGDGADTASRHDAGGLERFVDLGRQGRAGHLVGKETRCRPVGVEESAGADSHVVHESAAVETGQDFGPRRQIEAARTGVVSRDGEPDDKVLAHGAPDTVEDADGEARPIVQVAAPAVVAPVGQGVPELFDQGVVPGVHLDAVAARLLGQPRGADEAFDNVFNLGLRHGVTAVEVKIRKAARGATNRG